jgi:hypothetical protein
MKEPEVFLEQLQSSLFNFKLKGSGEISFHLGCSFIRYSTGTLCMAPGKYIDKMEDSYKQFFGEKPRQKYSSPLEKGDHPELDTTAFLEQDKIEIYQSLIGAIQWSVSIGRWDIHIEILSPNKTQELHTKSRGSQIANIAYIANIANPKDNVHIQTEYHPHVQSTRINHYTHILSITLK